MAFNKGYSTQRNTNDANNGKWEEADGFLNFALPDENGEFVQLGMIPLRKSDLNQADLFEQLAENPELAEALLKLVRVSFKVNRKKARTGPVRFNLSAI